MNLFEFNKDTGDIDFDTIVFALKPFNKLIKRDKSKDKSLSKLEIAYVWFWADYKSDFEPEPNLKKKNSEILNIIALPKAWKKDKDIDAAIEFYKELVMTPSTMLLSKTKKTAIKLSEYLEKVDFDKVDIKKVIDSANQIPKLISTIKELEVRVREEQEHVEKAIRGDKELAVWEDGIPSE